MEWLSLVWGCRLMCPDDPAKRMAALSIAVTLFKIYVALNNPQLGRNLIAAIQSPSFPPFNSFPASQRVTYRYYLGRMAILDDNLVSVMLC